jgi:hypothetical protein
VEGDFVAGLEGERVGVGVGLGVGVVGRVGVDEGMKVGPMEGVEGVTWVVGVGEGTGGGLGEGGTGGNV